MPSFYFIIYNHRIIKKAYFSISEIKNILRGDIMSCCSYTIGTIVDISDIMNQHYKFITIGKVPGDIYTYTRLVYSEETIILDHEYNEIGVEDLKVGDTVVTFHSNAMTMSIPPQTSVFIIEVK